MSGTTISIRDEASPVLAAIQTEAQAGDIAAAMGHAVRNLTREHLFALNAQRHRFGRNYYAQAARSTHAETSPAEIKLAITQTGIRQRRFGGYIRPDKKQWIAIPARQEAIAHRPEEFNNLAFVFFRRDLAALVRKDGVRGRKGVGKKEEAGMVYWWLKKEVHQQPDKTVLPSDTLIVQTALDAAARRLFRLKQRSASSDT